MANERISAIRIEREALELLDTYSITEPGFDVEDLAAAERLEVRRGELENIDAWLLRLPGGGGIIRVKDSPESGRFRFSVAHELGHWRMHPALSQGFLCTAADMVDYSRTTEEIEANLFAIDLLMPKPWIPKEVFRRDPDFSVVENLARDFRATLTAATRRYVELATHAVVMVFSQDGIVQWTVRSQRARPLFVEHGMPVPAGSLTKECIDNQRNAGPEQVDPAEWFPSRRFSRDSELFEDVRISKTYCWALTLLWVPEFG
jgi:hypothetical protein